jgi:hypothetical protein
MYKYECVRVHQSQSESKLTVFAHTLVICSLYGCYQNKNKNKKQKTKNQKNKNKNKNENENENEKTKAKTKRYPMQCRILSATGPQCQKQHCPLL